MFCRKIIYAAFLFCFIFFFYTLFVHEIEHVCSSGVVQSVDVIKYTDEEYEKYLTDPVCINLRLQLYF